MTGKKQKFCTPKMSQILSFVCLAIFSFSSARAMAASLGSITGAMQQNPDNSALTRLFLVLAVIFAVAAIFSIWRYVREQKKQLTPIGWIDSPNQIEQIFNNAVSQRSTFELQFPHRGVQRRPILRCAPEEFSSSGLVIEAEGVKTIARGWTGRLVNCYFKINAKGQHIYYAFSTTIKSVEIKLHGRCSLTLHIPEKLENRQKRAFLRITPPQEYLLGSILWMGSQLPQLEDLPYMERWPKPTLVMLPGKGKEQFEISDISAGGMRITIPRKEMITEGIELGVAEQLVLILDLLNPDDRSRMRLWLHCRVQNFASQYDTHNLEVGVQFLAWGQLKDGQTSIEWFTLNRSPEIDRLGNWIIRRHLELFRETEADDDYPI